MVTLYYLRRYRAIPAGAARLGNDGPSSCRSRCGDWLARHGRRARRTRARCSRHGPIDARPALASMQELGLAASRYRAVRVPRHGLLRARSDRRSERVRTCWRRCARGDRPQHPQPTVARTALYHAYNLLDFEARTRSRSTRCISCSKGRSPRSAPVQSRRQAAAAAGSALFEQRHLPAPISAASCSYPDRPLPGFLEKNRIPASSRRADPSCCDA